MYFDANQLANDAVVSGYDICIVGAGAAGIAMAHRLIGCDKRILLISNGASSAAAQSPADESIYQGTLGPFMAKVDPRFLTRSRLRMYGGTTNHFDYWARPLDDADLKPRPGYRDASWPIGIGELNRFYPDANDSGQFGPFNYDDIDFWAKALRGEPFVPLPGDELQSAILHSQPDNSINHFQEHYGPALRAASNVSVLFGANVLRIETDDSRQSVKQLACASLDAAKANKRFTVQARSYVLAQGGIEVIRLLQLSGNLGDNAKGHLGRGFMVHPVISHAAEVTFARPVPIPVQDFFGGRHVSVPRRLTGNGEQAPQTGPSYYVENRADSCLLMAWGILVPKPSVLMAKGIGNFRLILRFQSATFASVDITWEQIPNENSRITLDPSTKDPIFAQPVVRLDWNMLEADKRTVREGLELGRQYLTARDGGVKFAITTDLSGGPDHWTVDGSNQRLQAGDHHMGAARMARTMDDGIVDANLRLHAVDNLDIASSAVFPTCGYANPTLTIVALALRLADHLVEIVV